MAVSQLHVSTQLLTPTLNQSLEGSESPSSKRSRVEEKPLTLTPVLTLNDVLTKSASSKEKEIPSNSSPVATNDSVSARTDGDLPPPMKRAKIIEETDRIDNSIRIPTQEEKLVTTSRDTNHITQTTAANVHSCEKQKNSMDIPKVTNDIANSSTTESSSEIAMLTPPTTSAVATTKATPSTTAVASSENMNSVVKVGKQTSPISQQPESENDKSTPVTTAKPTLQASTQSLETAKKAPAEKETLTLEQEKSKAESTENSKDSKPDQKPVAATEEIEIAKKSETSAMSVIKSVPSPQAVSSTPALTANQVKAASTGKIPKATSAGTSALAHAKKKKVNSKRKRSGSNGSSTSQKKGQSSGRWTREEHQAFLEGLTECGREWKKVALRIPTRTSAQIRSHAQKYFAKLQRDQESSASNAHVAMVNGDFSTPLHAIGSGLVVPGTIITAAAPLAPSVQRNVERIIGNPRAAQKEVEDTMEALKERYRQLQKRLEKRRQDREERKKNRQQHTLPLSTASANSGLSSEASAFASPPSIPQNQKPSGGPIRKRAHLPIHGTSKSSGSAKVSAAPSNDDNSSVTSNVSSIAASRPDLGNGEILALQVLGGDLPRSESASDLHVLGPEALQGRGDSSIEVDGTMPSIHDNISSSSYHKLAPLPAVGNADIDSLMNQGEASLSTNDNNTRNSGDAATTESISIGGISAGNTSN